MSAELIARLRRMADAVGSIGYARALHNEAADALEAAEAENTRLRADMVRMFDDMKVTATERDAAEAKLAKIEPHIHDLRHWDQMQHPDPRNPDLPWAKGLLDDVWRILYPDNEGDET